MNSEPLPPMHTWLIEPLEPAVAEALARLRRAPDVQHLAVMPDVHLANDVCIGCVVATSHLLYPQAVGGDIGCGMLVVQIDCDADRLRDPKTAGTILAVLGKIVPATRHHRSVAPSLSDELLETRLSHDSLNSIARDEGKLQLGTLGSGNHFIEFQSDEQNRLWLMLHSGSRAMGQAIRAHHMAGGRREAGGLYSLDTREKSGSAYLNDVEWTRRYADANRRAMAAAIERLLNDHLGVSIVRESLMTVDHNHVARESHFGKSWLVHRKGAMPAREEASGILPGSMGTTSFHVIGRGCENALSSSAHGAGRAMSRESARRAINEREMHRQLNGVWYDYRLASALREEAPTAYKDVYAVLRAQRELVKIDRELRPILNYKGP